MIDDKEFDFVSQNSHILGGLLAVIAGAFLFGEGYGYLTGLIMLIYAAIKEFWWDYKYESTEVRGSSLRDFIFYSIGVVIGYLIIWIKYIL